MIAVVGPQSGRMLQSGRNPWGCLTWAELHVGHDKGIIRITGYRVCQKKSTKTGPNKTYSREISNMIKEGDFGLDPQSRILADLRNLILVKRSEGF